MNGACFSPPDPDSRLPTPLFGKPPTEYWMYYLLNERKKNENGRIDFKGCLADVFTEIVKSGIAIQ